MSKTNDDLRLTLEQEEMFRKYEYIVSITVSKFLQGSLPDIILDREDLLQYGRISLIRAIKMCNNEDTIKAFAIKMIRNGLINAIRQTTDQASVMAGSSAYFNDDTGEWEQIGSEIGADTVLRNDSFEQINVFSDLLMREAEKYKGSRQKGIICYIHIARGYSCADIADMMGTNVSAVYRWLCQAKPILSRCCALRETLGLSKVENSDK